MNDEPSIVLLLYNQTFFIDEGTRREIEQFMRSGPKPCDFITVDSIFGEEITVVAYNVGAIYTTSSEIRAKDREFRMMVKAEDPTKEDG